jgi:hypothetical protein
MHTISVTGRKHIQPRPVLEIGHDQARLDNASKVSAARPNFGLATYLSKPGRE